MRFKGDNRMLDRLGKGMMGADKTRNAFALLAVVLTTFMITTVFSLSINYIENMKLTQVRLAGTSADIALPSPDRRQEERIAELAYVSSIGRQYEVGSVALKNDEGRDQAIALACYDKTEWNDHFGKAIKDQVGSYPVEADEIMLSQDCFLLLGIDEPAPGMQIPLAYVDKNGAQEKTFRLSGWFRSYTGAPMGFVSEEYCGEAGYSVEEDGMLSLSLNSMPDDYLRIENDIELNDGQKFVGSVPLDSPDASVVAMAVLLVLFIVGSGYLLIYNVFSLSISKDARFYGLLRTIGTTQRQIERLVKRQAAKLAIIGISIGIVLATAVSFAIVPLVLDRAFEAGRSMMDAEVFFHPSIYVLSILFSAATVAIACSAPARAAARISPIEALHYRRSVSGASRKRSRPQRGGVLFRMALSDVFRDKKRAVLVFASLFMGITMALGVNGIIGSFKAENYIVRYFDYDFEYNDVQFMQYEQLEKETPQFDEHFVEQIRQVEGVGEVIEQKAVWAAIDFDEEALGGFFDVKYEDSSYKAHGYTREDMVAALRASADAGQYGCYVLTLGDEAVKRYNADHPDASIDVEAFDRGDIAIAGTDTDYNAPNSALVGRRLTLTADSDDGRPVEFAIGGAFRYQDYRDNLSEGIGSRVYVEVVPDVVYVSDAGMERLTKSPLISALGVDIDDSSQLERVDAELKAVNATLPTTEWQFNSPMNKIQEFDRLFYAMSFVGNGIAALLVVVGLANFVNVMLTGVVARRNEFAIMESVGTTRKQIAAMLTAEGGIYAAVTALLIATLGNAFLLLVASAVPHLADYAAFEYPLALVIGLTAAIFAICLCVPALAYKATSDGSFIERLRRVR